MQGENGHHEPDPIGDAAREERGETAADLERTYTSEEEAEIRRQLEDLGYI